MTPRFCVLALGKLGSQELNYSSDVDLIYVYESTVPTPESQLTGGPSGVAPVEYFTRLAEEFGRLVNPTTADGFLYRIDLELRPEGQLGQLVVSSEALAGYYEGWSATWEKAAFMKARMRSISSVPRLSPMCATTRTATAATSAMGTAHSAEGRRSRVSWAMA